MADMGNLEKMGRELKCPICLSLFRSAVSITCNHIFCSGCITESMKSASSCPVCKVPFHRREIRPAPHMDSLVGIFKSMEAATGTSIASTQVAPAMMDGPESGNGGNTSNTAQEAKKKKVASKKKKNSPKARPCPVTKPSFPAKKRVHVTPFPENETPTRREKISKPEEPKNQQNGDAEADKDKIFSSDKPGSPSLSPFFWLREGDDGGSAETLSGPLTLDTPLCHNAPSFSDIKDSDDEIPHNMTPNSKAKVAEVFDSEIFDWTQRPCSPELTSTPLKKKAKDKQDLYKIPEKNGNDGDLDIGGSFDKTYHLSDGTQSVSIDKKKHNSNKGRAMKNNPPHRTNKASSNGIQALHSNDNLTKRLLPKDGTEVEVSDHQLLKKPKRKEQNKKAGENTLETTRSSSEPKSKRIRTSDGDTAKKHGDTTKKHGVRSGSANKSDTLKQNGLITGSTCHIPLDYKSRGSSLCAERNIKGHNNMESNPGGHMPNISAEGCQNKAAVCTAPSVKSVLSTHNQAKAIEQSDPSQTKTFRKIQACTASKVSLKKCEKNIAKTRCAFCQSEHITEDSGEMVHYLNGQHVPAEFIGGVNAIHSHKNCLQWAPDVFFEDNSVFNLTTELTRSKRIKCACCGTKGAALGCFEKSCRKSFHFTCAKLIPECRWDNESFVMLCPLHRSSKLPSETCGLQRQSKRRTSPKGRSQARSTNDCGNIWTWSSGSPQKWVLCCSALSAEEKGIVSEFAKLAGVSVSTVWSPSVTHVIASTDTSGACKRTLKFLMAILNGKWIVSMDWVKICMECMEPVDEQRFEVNLDIHGICEGPKIGRLRVINKQPKLFNGLRFYLHGDYTKSYRGYLQDLVVAAGGTVLHRKPVSRDQQKLLGDSSLTFIACSLENQEKEKSKGDVNAVDRTQADAQAMADASGGIVVSSAWIIDSIAACNLQPATS